MPLFNVSSLNKITENNQKSDLTNQTKNEHKHILREIKKMGCGDFFEIARSPFRARYLLPLRKHLYTHKLVWNKKEG